MRRGTGLVVVALMTLGACGGGDDDAADDDVETGQPPADDDRSEPGDDRSEAADDQPEPADDAADPVDGDTTDGADAGSAGDGASSSGLADNTAVVTIGDQRFEFDVTPGSIQRCDPNFFGAFWALGADAAGNSIDIMLPPEGDPNFDEAPYATIGLADSDSEWTAKPDSEFPTFPEGSSQIDSYQVDGRSVSGTATFIDAYAYFVFENGNGDEPAPVSGTFEIVCAES